MPPNSSQPATAGTFDNEDRLPRVPLPSLQDSCRRFLQWCAPLLTSDELRTTEEAVAAFLKPGSPAHTLHAALESYDRDPATHSWLDQFWPSRYLGRRDRIALNANFFFLFADTGRARTETAQVDRAAELIAGAVHYKLLLDAERLPPAVQRGQPLSMDQTRFLFSTTRIPGAVQDTVRAPYSSEHPGPSPARHIVVFFRGTMFRMDVVGPGGRPYSRADLAAGLQAIRAAGTAGAATAGSGTSVGHLTTMARAEWAATRQRLLDLDPGNVESLETVETALFCLCLDELVPGNALNACDQLLHGNSGNRWFDKSVSLIVFGDGSAGINIEHCGLDGTTVLGFVDAILGSSAEKGAALPDAEPQGPPAVAAVPFLLDDDLRAQVRSAAESFAAYAAGNATTTLAFQDFGADTAKRLGMSPDAFVQLAFQLAHRRAKGLTGATYESIATRQYRRGRTEAMRVVTPEVLRFVEVMTDPATDTATRRAAFRAAADQHQARAKECQAGLAPEQHLWELQLIQKRSGAQLGVTEPLELYATPGWLVMRNDYLSTSSAPSNTIEYFGFGSTSSQCIGVGYVLLPDRFNVYLSTPRTVADAMVRFADRLSEALEELQDLLAEDRPVTA